MATRPGEGASIAHDAGRLLTVCGAARAERACLKAPRELGDCPGGGFFAATSRLDPLNEAMPGDTLEAEVRLFEINTAFCAFEISVVNKSRDDMKIASDRIGYRLFIPVGEHYEPQPMPEWFIPAIAEETP